jgi:hypothetical protein
MRAAGIIVLAAAIGACLTTSVRQAPDIVAVKSVFGPVMGAEVIAGRADAADVTWLLAGGIDLVRVDLAARRSQRLPLAVPIGDSCWELARLPNGSLWTLKGRHTLARIGAEGSFAEEVPLAAAHFGVFAAGDRLVYQEAAFTAPAPAFHMVSSDGRTRVPWSAITTRTFGRLARASVAALNMISCGTSLTRERPCWFPDEAVVFLVDADGRTRRLPLAGLHIVSPETLLTSENPPRPVRDGYVSATGDLWVLSSGLAPPGQENTPGGWVLARYGPQGEPRGQSRLAEAARVILRADGERVLLLLSSGQVGEVRAW